MSNNRIEDKKEKEQQAIGSIEAITKSIMRCFEGDLFVIPEEVLETFLKKVKELTVPEVRELFKTKTPEEIAEEFADTVNQGYKVCAKCLMYTFVSFLKIRLYNIDQRETSQK